MATSGIYWLTFISVVITLLVLDLGVFNTKDHAMGFRQSLGLSTFYIAISCLFGIYINYAMGGDIARDYFTGFLLEKAMSLDNIFVISIIFGFFKIPPQYQHRVLFWGILGVILMRAIMILAGATLLARFSWVLFTLAAILIYTGIKTLYFAHNGHNLDVNKLYIYRWLQSRFNIQSEFEGNKFAVKKNGKLFFTPLFSALVTIETMDLIFAIDSIPAIFAITQNTFIVYTSNIFAILGLRALFFCLADIIERFKYLKYSLAIILILIGGKILASHFIKVPTYFPLTITAILLAAGIIVSILKHDDKHIKNIEL